MLFLAINNIRILTFNEKCDITNRKLKNNCFPNLVMCYRNPEPDTICFVHVSEYLSRSSVSRSSLPLACRTCVRGWNLLERDTNQYTFSQYLKLRGFFRNLNSNWRLLMIFSRYLEFWIYTRCSLYKSFRWHQCCKRTRLVHNTNM